MKEEPVDILDEQGNKTGQSLLKSEAHKRGLWHGATHVWIYNSKGEVVMQLRSPKKILRPNIWDVSIGGHIATGKTPKETALTESQEELGLSINLRDLQFIGNGVVDDIIEPGHWNHRVYLWIYALKKDNLDPDKLQLEEDETSEVRWLSLDQLAKDIKDPAKVAQYSPTKISYETALAQIPKLLEAKS